MFEIEKQFCFWDWILEEIKNVVNFRATFKPVDIYLQGFGIWSATKHELNKLITLKQAQIVMGLPGM